jgi:large subunit ribosomal protein L13
MKTTFMKKDDIKRKWYLVDAEGKVLGDLATKLAVMLRGKNKPCFTPHTDCGDYIVVINAEKIKVTGKKLQDKKYYTHSGMIGKLKETSLQSLMAKKPTRALELAVRGMIPANKLRKNVTAKLKVFAGESHTHEAQKPEKIDL